MMFGAFEGACPMVDVCCVVVCWRVDCILSFAVCYVLYVACCLLAVVCSMLFIACCALCAVYCLVFVVCGVVVVCCL